MKINLKGEKGSVTVFVSSVMLFIAAMLAITYVSVTGKLSTEEKKMNRIQNEYIADNIDEEYQKVIQKQEEKQEDTNNIENNSNTNSSTQGTANIMAVKDTTNTLE